MGQFILNNIALVALFVGSGLVLVWPEIMRLAGASNEIDTLGATRLLNQASTLVLDVREPAEFAAGHLPKARNIPLKELGQRLEEIGKYKERAVLVTCRSGPRSGSACRLLKRAGFNTVYQLKGGLAAWQQASLPVEK
ncbi:MAG TPA: rhodanese-like domain-containing protein [Usitatibacter sp.]|nr:rhodanese-like domain-containing protein [Usitatibacter sp.]